jgi:hypothetical protein
MICEPARSVEVGCPRDATRLSESSGARDSAVQHEWARAGERIPKSPKLGTKQLRTLRRPTLPLAVIAPDHMDAILVPDPAGPHAELADRVLEVVDQLGGIESPL